MFAQKSTGRQSELTTKMSTESSNGVEIADSLMPSVISKGLVIVGNAYSNGQVEVSGKYQGDIKCKSLIVGPAANITGNVVADEILVGGRLKGTIRGRSVTLQESSIVEGDIHHQSLSISDGAQFAGRSYQEDQEITVPAKSDWKPESSDKKTKSTNSNGAVAA